MPEQAKDTKKELLDCKNDVERKLYVEDKHPEMLKDEFISKWNLFATAKALTKRK